MWTTRVPLLQTTTPAYYVAALLKQHVPRLPSWVLIDFCAGAGGPTPTIERYLNSRESNPRLTNGHDPEANGPIEVVLTDIHPHVPQWSDAAAQSSHIRYEPRPVDASAADPSPRAP